MRLLAITLCFVLSGSAALLYEVVWTRQLALVFGTSEPALAMLLAAYMGGLGLGALIARRFLARVVNAVRVYAMLELGIAAAALLVPPAIRAVMWLHGVLFGGQPELMAASTPEQLLFEVIAAFGVLVVPTTLMGATLPILVRAVVHADHHVGLRTGVLYAANTLGAVFGVVAAAFWLLPALGLRDAGLVGVGVNLFVALLALLLSRGDAPGREAVPGPVGEASARFFAMGPLMAGSGAIGLGYEIIWTRLLVQIVGSTVQAFALMLACFLLGLSLGGVLGTRYARTRGVAARAWAWAQCWAAGLSLAAFAALDGLPRWAIALAPEPGEAQLIAAGLAACLLVPGIVALGTTFPLAVRVAVSSDRDAGHASAQVYAWNTAGALVGSIATGFVLLPMLGFAGAILVCATGSCLLAGVALLQGETPRRGALAVVTGLGVTLLVSAPTAPMQLLRTSPFELRAGLATIIAEPEVMHFSAGRGATVLMLADDVAFELRTNGLPEAAIRRAGFPLLDDAPQWLVSLPLLARPEARDMLVIGLGGGSLVESIPPNVERIDVIELEAEVLAANRAVAGERAVDPLLDPRVRVAVNDARGALATTTQRWDVIVSQPSHPWTAGASHLFTRDFFRAAADHLGEDGVFAQWMGLDFVDEPLLRTLVASLEEAFAEVEVYWLPSARAIVCLAGANPIAMADGVRATLAGAPDRYAHLGVYGPEEVLAHRVLDADGATRFSAGAEVSSDDRNLFQMRSRHTTDLDRARVDALFSAEDPLRVADLSLDPYRLARRLVARGARPRVERLRDGWPEAHVRAGLDGLLALADGSAAPARAAFERALEIAPESVDARIGHVRALGFDASAATHGDGSALAWVSRGIWAATEARWTSVAAMEARLAAVEPASALYSDALRLRVHWRLALEDPARARDALTLVDRLLPIQHRFEDRVLRARVLALAGRHEAALATLSDLVRHARPADRALLDTVVIALGEIEESARLESRRSALAVTVAARLEAISG